MDEFPSNSKHTRQPPQREEKQIRRVTEAEVVRRKKPLGKRFLSHFFGGDARAAWAYVLYDHLIPDAKYTIWDSFTSGIERSIFPDSDPRRSRARRGGGMSHVNYNNRYSSSDRRDRDERPQLSRRARTLHDFDEIILPHRVDAEEVIDALFELLSKYEVATVGNLYDLVGVSSNFTDEKYGWTDLRGARVERVRNGYLLDLPRPEPID